MTSSARSPTPQRILDAAEKVFAELGYEGASMRSISETAKITQALLHYHYKTKERLYEAVFERRSTAINEQRKRLLEGLKANDRTPTLEDVLHTYYSPVFLDPANVNVSFSQLVSSLALSGDEQAKAMIRKYYDPIAERYVAAFKDSAPGLTDETAAWAYLMALGARTHLSPAGRRAERLSGGACDPSDPDRSMGFLIRFVAAGITALADRTVPPKPVSKEAPPQKGRPKRRSAAKAASAQASAVRSNPADDQSANSIGSCGQSVAS